MMHYIKLVLIIALLPVLLSMDSCKKTFEPDLAFPQKVEIFNSCTNTKEIRTNEFYFIDNCCNPYYPQKVIVSFECNYYYCGFYDCLGYPWYVSPGSAMTLVRYVTNIAGPSGNTKDAKQPDIEFEFVALDPTTNESDTVVFTSSLGSVSAGANVPYSQNIIFRYPGEYNNRLVIDKGNTIEERDETNNTTFEDYSITGKKKQAIEITDYATFLKRIENSSSKHVVFKDGLITIVE